MKRGLCFILCLAMLLGLCPAAFAADASEFIIQDGILVEYTGSGGDVKIPAGVTEIGPSAFSRGTGRSFVTSVIIPEGCVKIGDEAFYFLGDLTSSVKVTLPSTLREIGDNAFECAHITQIDFPEGLVSIGADAFTQTYVKTVTLPASLTSLGQDAFNNCTKLTEVTWPGHTFTQADLQKYFFATPFYYAGGSSGNTNPDPEPTPGTDPGTATPSSDFTIENGVLTHCSAYYATSITVPEGVTKIAEGAFGSCSLMQSLTLPSTLRTIGSRAFSGCNMRRIDIPDSVTSIENYAFLDCRYLSQVKLPAGLTRIEEHTFQDCVSLTQITLPSGLKSIGGYAFDGCAKLKNVSFPASLTQIGETAFYGTGLSGAINLHAGLKTLGSGAFGGTNITSITIPEGIESIGPGFAANCESLTSITFPKTGKAVEGMKGLSPGSFWDYIGAAPNLKEIKNIPSTAYAAALASNQAVIDGLGNPQTYIYPRNTAITAKAKEITAGLTGDYEKASAIQQWVSKNITYDYDYYGGRKSWTYTSADDVLEHRLAVCGGFANLTRALLQASGIPAICISGWSDNERHGWNAAYVDGRWIWMDATFSRPGQGAIYDSRYFDPTIFFLSSSHWKDESFTGPSQEMPEPGDSGNPSQEPDKDPSQEVPSFTDVPSWFTTEVGWAAANGITKGYGDGTFGTDDDCTNPQILTFLWRAAGEHTAKTKSPFTVQSYYQDAVDWAYGEGIIDASFNAYGYCTRASAMEYIWKAFGKQSAAASSFVDVPANAPYAAAVNWGVAKGLTKGYGNNDFRPGNICSRGEIAAFLYRAYSAR